MAWSPKHKKDKDACFSKGTHHRKKSNEILSVHMIKFLKFKKCLSILEKQLSKGTTKGEKYLLDIK